MGNVTSVLFYIVVSKLLFLVASYCRVVVWLSQCAMCDQLKKQETVDREI